MPARRHRIQPSAHLLSNSFATVGMRYLDGVEGEID